MNTQLSVETLSPVTYNQIQVITTELLAQLYGTDPKYIQNNTARNESRFVEGKHFFKLEGDELKDFKNRPSLRGSVAKHTRALILWTERGAARHAKMLETDQAWEVFEKLEDCYFNQKALPEKTTSTEQRLHLRDAVKMLVRKKSIRYEDAYRLIHQRFSVGHIDEIEEAQLPVAIEYIHRLVLEGELIRESYTLTDSEKDSFNTNLHALCHNVRCINDIWKAQLRPALLNLDSPLAARLHDRFASNMCILPIIEKLVGRHVPDSPR